MSAKLSMELIQERLKDRPFKLIEYSGTTIKKSTFKCDKCDLVWEAKLYQVFNGSGCPACNRGKVSTEEIYKRVESQGKILVNYKGNPSEKSLLMCGVKGCGFQWEANLNSPLKNCPKCLATNKLLGTGISLVRFGGNIKNKHTLKHSCGYIWESSLSSVPTCPKCRTKIYLPKTDHISLILADIQIHRSVLKQIDFDNRHDKYKRKSKVNQAIVLFRREKVNILCQEREERLLKSKEAYKMRLVKREEKLIQKQKELEESTKKREEREKTRLLSEEKIKKFSTWESSEIELDKLGFKLIRYIAKKSPEALVTCKSCGHTTGLQLLAPIYCSYCGHGK